MRISICSKLFDISGNVLVNADIKESDLSSISRRVSRSATLDGGCVIVDNGYTPSDSTLTIVIKSIGDSDRLKLISMIKRHSFLTVAFRSSIYEGVVESVSDNGSLYIRFLIKSAINE